MLRFRPPAAPHQSLSPQALSAFPRPAYQINPRALESKIRAVIRATTAGLAIALAPAVQASELIVGFGAVEFNSNLSPNETQLSIEYHLDPFHEWHTGHVGWGGAIIGHATGDMWAGFGLVARQHLNDRWFIEGSLMPGLYFENSASTNLGHTVEFRSLLAVGYKLSETAAISLAVDHRSNARLSDFNPGANGLSLRYHLGF